MEKKTIHSLNPNNKIISKDEIKNMLEKYGLNTTEIKDYELFKRAFVHYSYSLEDTEHTPKEEDPNYNENVVPFQEKSNERLEFIGDSMLGAVITFYLNLRYPNMREGWMTTTKGKLVCGKTLCKLGRKMKLDEYILVSDEIEKKYGRSAQTIMEDCFESIVGAIFTTFEPKISDIKQMNSTINGSKGFNACQIFILNVFEMHLNFTKIVSHDGNYKHQLMRYYQTNFDGQVPSYTSIKDLNGASSKKFKEGVYGYDGMTIIGSGLSNKKSHAQQLASRNALIYLGETVDSESEDEN
jgi:ribonuclease III